MTRPSDPQAQGRKCLVCGDTHEALLVNGQWLVGCPKVPWHMGILEVDWQAIKRCLENQKS